MPAESVIAVSLIACGFAVFMITLAGVALYSRTPEAKRAKAPVRPTAPGAGNHGFRDAA